MASLPSKSGRGGGSSIATNASVRGECGEDGWVSVKRQSAIVLVVLGRGGTVIIDIHSIDLVGLG